MYKLIHLHSDPKFISSTVRFVCEKIYNEIIFIGEKNSQIIDTLERRKIRYHIFQETEIDNIINKIKDFDGVVIHDLNKFNTHILKTLPPNKKVFLRLFGYELYNKKKDKFLSRTSLELSVPINLNKYTLKEYIKRRIKRLLGIEYKVNFEQQKNLYSRIDAILLYNEFEYQELSKYFYLPKFIPINIINNIPNALDLSLKKEQIILGNSRHAWNNHLDIFRIINKSKKKDKFSFILFFNYGPNNLYTDEVRKKSLSNFRFIEDFLDREVFSKIYNESSALVINSFRQHALGNIFTAIRFGVKVYLNPRSSTYHWLKSEGFNIYDISNLAKDIDKNHIKLNESEYLHNIKCYEKLKNNYTQEDFINNIIPILENGK